jgi:hypothetical protein
MAIPIKEEEKEYFEQFKSYENCYFCGDKTPFWHEKTNNPLCECCASKHKVSELPNRFKGEERKSISNGDWYTPDDLKRHLLNNNYSKQIADELCEQYAKNLQLAYEKGKQSQAKA